MAGGAGREGGDSVYGVPRDNPSQEDQFLDVGDPLGVVHDTPDDRARDLLKQSMSKWAQIMADYRATANDARMQAGRNSIAPYQGYQDAMRTVYGDAAPDYRLDQVFQNPWGPAGSSVTGPGGNPDQLFPPTEFDAGTAFANYTDDTPEPLSEEAVKDNAKYAPLGVAVPTVLGDPILSGIAYGTGFMDPSRGAPDEVVAGGTTPPGKYAEPGGGGWPMYYADNPQENPPSSVRMTWDAWLEGEPPYDDWEKYGSRVPEWYRRGEERDAPSEFEAGTATSEVS